MANRRGYIKIWRSILDSDVYAESYLVRSLFLDLLLTAQYSDGKTKAGTVVTTYEDLSKRLGVQEGRSMHYPDRFQIYRALGRLKTLEIIFVTRTKKNHIINIRNWKQYQGSKSAISEYESNKAARPAARPAARSKTVVTPDGSTDTATGKVRAHVRPHVRPHVPLFSKKKNKKKDTSDDVQDQKQLPEPVDIKALIDAQFPQASIGARNEARF